MPTFELSPKVIEAVRHSLTEPAYSLEWARVVRDESGAEMVIIDPEGGRVPVFKAIDDDLHVAG